jgi:hypothetical protein
VIEKPLPPLPPQFDIFRRPKEKISDVRKRKKAERLRRHTNKIKELDKP